MVLDCSRSVIGAFAVLLIVGDGAFAQQEFSDTHPTNELGQGNYAIVVSTDTLESPGWRQVVEQLSKKHAGRVITFDEGLDEVSRELASHHPRRTCFVATVAETTRDFVAQVHHLTRAYDDDPWLDTQWGILTGILPRDALEIVNENKPLVVRRVASGTEVALDMCQEGLWYDELVKGKKVEKKAGGRITEDRGPDDTTRALAATIESGEADLFVTSGHATERSWMIGFRYRNGFFRSRQGQLYGETVDKERFEINSDHPRVYLPIGNCLMGHIDSDDAMALAWMRSVSVRQMAGYTVPTWYGYAGWGLLDYFVEQPGRYSLVEAFFANQQALLHRLYAAAPQTRGMKPEPGRMVREIGEIERSDTSKMDVIGLLHDRDVVAFYGDPGWEARMVSRPTAYDQKLTIQGDLYRFTVTPRRGEQSFEPVNRNGAQRGWRPVVEVLDHRIRLLQIVEGNELSPVVADDFILIPNPRKCDPQRDYTISFRAERIETDGSGRGD